MNQKERERARRFVWAWVETSAKLELLRVLEAILERLIAAGPAPESELGAWRPSYLREKGANTPNATD